MASQHAAEANRNAENSPPKRLAQGSPHGEPFAKQRSHHRNETTPDAEDQPLFRQWSARKLLADKVNTTPRARHDDSKARRNDDKTLQNGGKMGRSSVEFNTPARKPDSLLKAARSHSSGLPRPSIEKQETPSKRRDDANLSKEHLRALKRADELKCFGARARRKSFGRAPSSNEIADAHDKPETRKESVYDPIVVTSTAARGNGDPEHIDRILNTRVPWSGFGSPPPAWPVYVRTREQRALVDGSEREEYIRGVGHRRWCEYEETRTPPEKILPSDAFFVLADYQDSQTQTGLATLSWTKVTRRFDISLIDLDMTESIFVEHIESVHYDMITAKFSFKCRLQSEPNFVVQVFHLHDVPESLRDLLHAIYGDIRVHCDQGAAKIKEAETGLQIKRGIKNQDQVELKREPELELSTTSTVRTEGESSTVSTAADGLDDEGQENSLCHLQKTNFMATKSGKIAMTAKHEHQKSSRRDNSALSLPRKQISAGDLVLRVMPDDGPDRDDCWDGPFPVLSVPEHIVTGPLVTPMFGEATKSHKQAIDAYLDDKVLLDFPNGCSIEPWVQLRQLRALYDVLGDHSDGADPANLFNESEKHGRRSRLYGYGPNIRDEEILRVAQLHSSKHVVCRYHDGRLADDGLYQVDRLRGKRLMVVPKANFRDEPLNDANIAQCLARGTAVGADKVVLVQYKTHWAGWPVECDSWERAHDNLPAEAIEAYEARWPDNTAPIHVVPKEQKGGKRRQL